MRVDPLGVDQLRVAAHAEASDRCLVVLAETDLEAADEHLVGVVDVAEVEIETKDSGLKLNSYILGSYKYEAIIPIKLMIATTKNQ